MQVKYIAHDGSEFTDESLCRAYEHLIEASKDHKFKKLVKGMFDGLLSFEDDGYGTRTEEVFRLRSIDKFTANLVKALPALTIELERALSDIALKS